MRMVEPGRDGLQRDRATPPHLPVRPWGARVEPRAMSRPAQRAGAVRRSLPLVRCLAVWLLVGWLLPFAPVAGDPLAASCAQLHADGTPSGLTTDASGHAATHHCPACGVTASALLHRAPVARTHERARGDAAGCPSRRFDPPYRPPPPA